VGNQIFLKKEKKRHLQDIKVATAIGYSNLLLTKEDGAFFYSMIQFLLICPTSALETIFKPQNYVVYSSG